MKDKNGQMSIFLIIGVVIIILAITSLILKGPQNRLDVDTRIKQIDIRDIKFYMEECVKKELDYGIDNILSKGGIYGDITFNSVRIENDSIIYFLYNDTSRVINTSMVADEISFFTYDTLNFCDEEYRIGKSTNTSYVYDYFVKTQISEYDSNININIEIMSSLGDKEKQEDMMIIYPIRQDIYRLLKTAEEIVNYDIDNQYMYSLSEIIRISQNNGFNISIFNTNNDTFVYKLYDNTTEYYELNFATQYKSYTCQDIPVDDDNMMQIAVGLCLR